MVTVEEGKRARLRWTLRWMLRWVGDRRLGRRIFHHLEDAVRIDEGFWVVDDEEAPVRAREPKRKGPNHDGDVPRCLCLPASQNKREQKRSTASWAPGLSSRTFPLGATAGTGRQGCWLRS